MEIPIKHTCHEWTNQAHPQKGEEYTKNLMKHKCHGWTNQILSKGR